MLFPPSQHLNRDQRVHDALEGQIPLTSFEKQLLAHPLSQVMDGQRQSPFLPNAYPGARHTLIELAVGTCHFATQMLDAIVENASTALRKGRASREPKEGEVPWLGPEVGTVKLATLALAVRFTALFLHVGRGPLGALGPFLPTIDQARTWFGSRIACGLDGKPIEIEVEVEVEVEVAETSASGAAAKVKKKVKKRVKAYRRENPLELLAPLLPAIEAEFRRRSAAVPGTGVPRVWSGFLSGVIFTLVMSDTLKADRSIEVTHIDGEEEVPDPHAPGGKRKVLVRSEIFRLPAAKEISMAFPVAVAAIMGLGPSELVPEWVGQWTPFVRDVVAGMPVSADLVATMERDHHGSGIAYGLAPKDDLLSAILPVVEDGRIRVGWKLTGIGAIERTIIEAAQMSQHVYGNKASDAAFRMMRRATRLWDSMDPAIADLSTLPRMREFLLGFGRDDAFLSLLAGNMSFRGRTSYPPFNDIPQRLTHADLWHGVGTFRDVDDDAGLVIHDAVVKKAQQCGWGAQVITVRIRPGAIKPLLDEPARVLNPDEDGRYCRIYPPEKRWGAMTRLLDGIDKSRTFLRVYVDAGPGSGPIPEQIRHAAKGRYNRLMRDAVSVSEPRPSSPTFSAEEEFTLRGQGSAARSFSSMAVPLSSADREEGVLAIESLVEAPSPKPASLAPPPSAGPASLRPSAGPPSDGAPPMSAAPGNEPEPVSGLVAVATIPEAASDTPAPAADPEVPTEHSAAGPAEAGLPAEAAGGPEPAPDSMNGKAFEG